MERGIHQLLDSQVLNEDVKQALIETWEQKLSEARRQIEGSVRAELSNRYEYDKSKLVEAMEKFLHEHVAREVQLFVDTKRKSIEETIDARKSYEEKAKKLKETVLETLKTELEEIAREKKAIAEERVKLQTKLAECDEEYKAKAVQDLSAMEAFVKEQLQKELQEFMLDKKNLAEQKVLMHQALRESKLALKESFASRLNKLEKFVLGQLNEEIQEFEQDKKLFEARRIELETEAKTRIAETQKTFIRKASDLVQKTVLESMTKEMSQLKNDLKIARENNFGRRLFESFAAEFMTSHLAEGTEIRKYQKIIAESAKREKELKRALVEKENALSSAQRKITLAEERAARAKIMSEILNPLSKDQRVVMVNLLEGVRTEKLQEQFKRYLPTVLRETANKGQAPKKVLTENEAQNASVALTGDRENLVSKSIEIENTDPTVIQIRKLAGLKI